MTELIFSDRPYGASFQKTEEEDYKHIPECVRLKELHPFYLKVSEILAEQEFKSSHYRP